MIKKFRLLSPNDCQKIRDQLDLIEQEDGKKTAGNYVKDLKNNRQVTFSNEKARPLLTAIQNHLLNSIHFKVITYAKRLCKTMINIHGPGEFYGKHCDNTYISQPNQQPSRADMSFTLFLEDPKKYKGGELSIQTEISTVDFKLEEGEMVIYDSGLLHQVKPVEEGTRIGFVGWIESWVPDARMRNVLTDFDMQIGRIKDVGNLPRENLDELHRIYNEFLRANMR